MAKKSEFEKNNEDAIRNCNHCDTEKGMMRRHLFSYGKRTSGVSECD